MVETCGSEPGCRAAPNSNLGRWRSSMARTPPPLGGVAFALALTSCARAGPLLAPISCLARAITPRAPSADRLRGQRGAIGATQDTLQSLSCRGQYGCSVVKGVPPAPDCPCIALASCLARAAHGLTDPHVHAQTTSEFLRQPAPVGGRALGRSAWFGTRRMRELRLMRRRRFSQHITYVLCRVSESRWDPDL